MFLSLARIGHYMCCCCFKGWRTHKQVLCCCQYK